MIFKTESLFQIYCELKKLLKTCSPNDTIEFEVIDPDISNEFSGTLVSVAGKKYLYRPFKVWSDLAEVLQCRIMTPSVTSQNYVKIKYKPLNLEKSWHNNSGIHITEKYGSESEFFRIKKLEEPYFLNDYIRALESVRILPGIKILNLGINRGDEFKIFGEIFNDIIHTINFTGIDHCESAIKEAAGSMRGENFKFINEDIARIKSIELEKQDLVISIGTLQSPDIDGKEIFKYVIQDKLKNSGNIILGFPNSRYIDSEVVYGAKTKNYTESNLNLLINDMSYYKKYLQQHKFKVLTFGKYYIFMVGIRWGT